MVLLKFKKTHRFFCFLTPASDPEVTQTLDLLVQRLVLSARTVFQLLSHPLLVCTVLHFFLNNVDCLISFTYTSGTEKQTNKHMYSCLPTLLRCTSPPGKRLFGRRRGRASEPTGRRPCVPAPTSSAPVSSDVNQTDERRNTNG